eukprot:scaffold18632_cov34-Tisochrysis_lutea.AAC.11
MMRQCCLKRRHQPQSRCLVRQQGQCCGGVWKKLRKKPVVKVCTVQSHACMMRQCCPKMPSAAITVLGGTTGT